MTTTASGRQRTSTCDGVTRTFANPDLLTAGDLQVYLLNDANAANEAGTLLSLDADYVISADLATITTTIAQPIGKFIRRWRETSREQVIEIRTNAGLPAATQEGALDRLSLVDEEIADDLARLGTSSLRLASGEIAAAFAPAARRGQVVAFDDDEAALPTLIDPAAWGGAPVFRVSAPYNLLPNTQWEIFSGLIYERRWKADGSGLLPTCQLISHDTTGPLCTLQVDAVPAGWLVGHIVKINPYVGGNYMGDWPMPIVAIPDGTHFQVRLPLNHTPNATGVGTVNNINIGGSASVGTGDAADYWKKTVTTQVWRDDNAINLQHGALYALGMAKGAAGAETVDCPLDPVRFRGRQIVFGAWAKKQASAGPGTHQLFISCDGTGGGSTFSVAGTVGAGAYEYLEVTATIPVDATFAQVGLQLLGANGDTYLFINPMLSFGNYLGPNGYSKPREQLIPLVKLEPAPWINTTFTFPADAGHSSVTFGYGFPFDLHAITGGAIARSVRLVEGAIEAINTNAVVAGIGGSRLIGWSDGNVDPIRLGNFMSQQVINVKCHQQLRIPLVNGTGHVFSGVASDAWANLSVDLDVFHLE